MDKLIEWLKELWRELTYNKKTLALAAGGVAALGGVLALVIFMSGGNEDYLDNAQEMSAGIPLSPEGREITAPMGAVSRPATASSDSFGFITGKEGIGGSKKNKEEDGEYEEEEEGEAIAAASPPLPAETANRTIGQLKSLFGKDEQQQGQQGSQSYSGSGPAGGPVGGERASALPSYGSSSSGQRGKTITRSASSKRRAASDRHGNTRFGRGHDSPFGTEGAEHGRATVRGRDSGVRSAHDTTPQSYSDPFNIPDPAGITGTANSSLSNNNPFIPLASSTRTIIVPPVHSTTTQPGGGWQGGLRICYKKDSNGPQTIEIKVKDNCRSNEIRPDKLTFGSPDRKASGPSEKILGSQWEPISIVQKKYDDPGKIAFPGQEGVPVTEAHVGSDARKVLSFAVNFISPTHGTPRVCSDLNDMLVKGFLIPQDQEMEGSEGEPFMVSVIPTTKNCRVFLKCNGGQPGARGSEMDLRAPAPIHQNCEANEGFNLNAEPECTSDPSAATECLRTTNRSLPANNRWGCDQGGRCVPVPLTSQGGQCTDYTDCNWAMGEVCRDGRCAFEE
ncbi:MAG: hypothetical protein HY401_05235 [Elusimicrobia bacterium]|nr:hypothetical protein [Elusimicrobiota bacterium]